MIKEILWYNTTFQEPDGLWIETHHNGKIVVAVWDDDQACRVELSHDQVKSLIGALNGAIGQRA